MKQGNKFTNAKSTGPKSSEKGDILQGIAAHILFLLNDNFCTRSFQQVFSLPHYFKHCIVYSLYKVNSTKSVKINTLCLTKSLTNNSTLKNDCCCSYIARLNSPCLLKCRIVACHNRRGES